MALNKFSVEKGFTLVELLLVIVLLAIIMALVTLSGANMMESTSAQTEARKLIRTVQSLRSAWLACYADSQVQMGVTHPADVEMIRAYSDRAVEDDIERYGNISVVSDDAGSIHIGFRGPWHLGNMNRQTINTMIGVIGNQMNDYNISFDKTPINNDAPPPKSIFIKIR
jgi:prepilin-type N-terminal cleavage/methylation domain-containing protein